MKKYIQAVLFLAFLISGVVFAQQSETKKTDKFDPKRDPFADVKKAVELAAKDGKRILLDVGGEWCIWCHRVDDFISSNDSIKSFIETNFVVLKVNMSPENKNEKFLSQFPKIPGYPHFFVLESDGKFLHSQGTGELEKGKSYSSDLVMNFLKAWAPIRN